MRINKCFTVSEEGGGVNLSCHVVCGVADVRLSPCLSDPTDTSLNFIPHLSPLTLFSSAQHPPKQHRMFPQVQIG